MKDKAFKWEKTPGVYYSDADIKQRDRRKELGPVRQTAPTWGVTTTQAAAMLNSSYSAARVLLRRKKVKFSIVRQLDSPPRTFWDRESVEKLVSEKAPLVNPAPSQIIGAQRAADYLGVSRGTINRAIWSGVLPVQKVRIPSPQGPRKTVLIAPEELEQFGAKIDEKHRDYLNRKKEREALTQ